MSFFFTMRSVIFRIYSKELVMSTWLQTFTALPGLWSTDAYARFNPASSVKKAKPSEYAKWVARQPKSVKHLLTPSKCNQRFACMDRRVPILLNGRKIYHQRHVIAIDPKSEYAGNIYNTDKKIVLYIKFFMSFLARPIHLVVKTCYHLFFIGVFATIAKEVKNRKIDEKALKNPKRLDAVPKPIDKAAGTLGQRVVRSLVDSFRTPLYETIMTIVALVALFTAPFSPGLLYDYRCFTEKLTKELFWGAKYDMPKNLTPCMYRVGNIMDFEKKVQPADLSHLVVYKNPNNRVLTAFDNWMVSCALN